jgi:Ricin-type beta-trefoil lectin domain
MVQGCTDRSPSQIVSVATPHAGIVSMGTLRIMGQCLEARGQGQPLVFTACKESPAQDWRHATSTAQLHNAQGLCVEIGNDSNRTGAPLIGWPCHEVKSQKWGSETSHDILVIAVSGLKAVPPSTPLAIRAGKLIEAATLRILSEEAPLQLASLSAESAIFAGGGGFVVAIRSKR